MKYDKYGDPIVETLQEADKKTKNAFLVMILIQCVLIVLNIVFRHVLVASITTLLYMFIYITFLKGYSNKKDDVILPGYCKIARIVCPIVFAIAAVLGVFGG